MVVAARVDRLVAGDARAEVDPLDEALGGEELEHAVDARDPDPAARGAQPVEDLLRGQAAVLLGEQIDHGAAGAAVPEALALERLQRRRPPSPASAVAAIATMIAVLMNRFADATGSRGTSRHFCSAATSSTSVGIVLGVAFGAAITAFVADPCSW